MPLLENDAFLLTVVSAYIRPCDIIPDLVPNSTESFTRMYQYTTTESPLHLSGAKTSFLKKSEHISCINMQT